MATQAEINMQIGNATRELSPPDACFRYDEPANGYECVEWMDDRYTQPSETATMAKATELANNPLPNS
jgi:hypothetical protein